MKAIKFFGTLLCVTMAATNLMAQDEATKEECLLNQSLFYEAAKVKNYAEAVDSWNFVYNTCPQMSKAIYTYGVQIVTWQMEKETDKAKKEELFQKLMKVYDDWMINFGNDTKVPAAEILGRKALTYMRYKPEDKQTPYNWLKECATTLKKDAKATHLQQYVVLSYTLYKENEALAEAFINDYIFTNDLLENNAADPEERDAAKYGQVDGQLDLLFAQSGAADCTQLEKIYGEKVEQNKENLEFLNSTLRLFRGMGCKESKVFFAASTYAHKISPSAESANGCAEMCYKNGEYTQAIKFYEEAAELATDDNDKADYFFKIAQIYNSNLNSSSKSREFARLSLEKNPNQGNPYLLIGTLYAGTRNVYDDPVLNKTIYWVAVDKFRKAKEVDNSPECVETANKLINTYSQYFPSKEDVFMHPDLESGKQFCVGGWIGECTTCR